MKPQILGSVQEAKNEESFRMQEFQKKHLRDLNQIEKNKDSGNKSIDLTVSASKKLKADSIERSK